MLVAERKEGSSWLFEGRERRREGGERRKVQNQGWRRIRVRDLFRMDRYGEMERMCSSVG
jgi:hypothetical protein